ncbi:MAG: hypothetical protein K9H64_22545 [Bacteroidales bacterium]|nr:hypothetical protein [Bacteroidales bacterium]
MKSKILILSLILMGFVIILFNSCDPKDDDLTGPPITPVNTPIIEFNDRAINVASEPMELQIVNGGTYTYLLTGDCPIILVGDLLLGDDDEYGYVRKVTEVVSQTKTKLVLNTIEGSFLEVVKRCDIDTTFALPMLPSDLSIPGVQIIGDSLVLEDYVLVDETFYLPPLPSINLFAAIDRAYLVIKNPTLDFELHVTDGVLNEYRTLYSATTTFGCDISVDVTALFLYDMQPITLYQKTERYTQWVWFVPIIHVVTTTVKLMAHFDLMGQLNTDITGMGFDQNLEIGAHYYNPSWEDLNSAQIYWNEPDVMMTAKAEATIRPYIEFKVVDKLYNLAGPSVRTEPYIEALASYTWPDPEFCIEVSAGISVGCGFSGMDFFGIGNWNSPNFPLLSGTIFPEHCWPVN